MICPLIPVLAPKPLDISFMRVSAEEELEQYARETRIIGDTHNRTQGVQDNFLRFCQGHR